MTFFVANRNSNRNPNRNPNRNQFQNNLHCSGLLRTMMLMSALSIALVCSHSSAQSAAAAWPQRPIKLIVPTSAGPGPDQVARLIATRLSDNLGQTVLVENRPGANGLIGTDAIAKAAPDGYTLGFATSSSMVTAVFLTRNLPYDPRKDFTPITAAVEPVTCLAVHPSMPVNSVKEFLDYARANPGKVSYGSAGIGSVFHMIGESLQLTTGVQLTHVPYKGVPPAMADLVAGQIQSVFISMTNALPQMRGGKARILAVLESQRFARAPNIPTIGEAVPGFEKPASWFGFFGPAGLPPAITNRMHQEVSKVLNQAELRNSLEDSAFVIIGNTPAEFSELMRRSFDVYGKAVKAAGLKPE